MNFLDFEFLNKARRKAIYSSIIFEFSFSSLKKQSHSSIRIINCLDVTSLIFARTEGRKISSSVRISENSFRNSMIISDCKNANGSCLLPLASIHIACISNTMRSFLFNSASKEFICSAFKPLNNSLESQPLL